MSNTPSKKPAPARKKAAVAVRAAQDVTNEETSSPASKRKGAPLKEEQEDESVGEEERPAVAPPAKRRKAAAALSSPARRPTAAGDRESTEEARTKHIGKKFSPGNGQLDYTLTAPEPTRDVRRTFHFEGYPTFLPNLSPEEILRQGSFGGGFFRAIKSKRSGKELHDDWEDLPKEWWKGLPVSTHLTRPEPHDGKVNKWGAKVGQPYEEWEKNGWIVAEHDARGWFQWYCRFFRGRRIGDEDDRQIGRWDRLAGEASGRWRRIFYGKYHKAGLREVERDAEEISKGIRQTLNHWAYEPTTEDLFRYLDEKGVPIANEAEAGDLNE
ncbi:hypothetical protein BCR35DRAFT_316445 [Leucosporidium creatinivorum]|uniref:Uncharacterized protein n=1 Tax=Leucosporidium creatinivorum TaxID=106004 RepID=A0A1Y2C452_9BASI|nr:hypothetical protein BCR35DRAFT_316445 [Leucosporidium creatinivorum]